MVLQPTNDLVCFPLVAALGPGESRALRLGRRVAPGATEQTYRVYVEELPALKKKSDTTTNLQVNNRVGVPVFVQPQHVLRSAHIQGAAVADDTVSIRISNTGNVHYLPRSVHLRGLTASGQVALEASVPGWYILAGGERVFKMKTRPEVGSRLHAVEVEAISDQLPLKQRIVLSTAVHE